MTLKFRKLSYALGAEVIGVDISKPLDDQSVREIHQAFLEYYVLLFRDQPCTQEQYIAFARRFGEPDDNKTRRTRNPHYPEISTVINKPKLDGSPADPHWGGSDWHSDASFKIAPTSITLLHGVEVPPVGGDTQFANMYLAYDTLSEGMKKLLDGLDGVHMQEEKLLDHSSPERLEESRRSMTIAHPLVRVHPETGRKALYVGEKVQLIAGMTPEESRPLIDFLCDHARRPQFIYRHQWRKDDLLMWDNRCTNHNAIGDYDRQNQLRHTEKISLIGTPLGHPYDDATQQRNYFPH